VRWIREQRYAVGLHDMGVIYRQPLIAAFERGLLNSHIGILPEYKGRSVMEWSLLAGRPTGITVFFVDTGIDTGAEIVLRREVSVLGKHRDIASAKDALFERDGEMYREALVKLEDPSFQPERNEGGRRYYVMSGLLREVVGELLARDTLPS
jgi:methionyl-tRNA formyltransferase